MRASKNKIAYLFLFIGAITYLQSCLSPGAYGCLEILTPQKINIFQNEKILVKIDRGAIIDELRMGVLFGNNANRSKTFNSIKYHTLKDTIIVDDNIEIGVKISFKDLKSVQIDMLSNFNEQYFYEGETLLWLYNIKPITPEDISFVVTVSGSEKTENGRRVIYQEFYEGEIKVISDLSDKLKYYQKELFILFITLLLLITVFLYKIIPNKYSIKINMDSPSKTDFRGTGLLGVVIYLITIISFVVLKTLEISLLLTPLIFIGTILIYAVFTAVALRDNDKLTEENFLSLMEMAIRKIPPFDRSKQKEKTPQQPNELTSKKETFWSKLYKWTDHKLISIIIFGFLCLLCAFIGNWLGIREWFK